MARRTVTDKVLMAQYTGSPPFFEAQARFARAYRGPGGVGVSHSQNPDLQKCGNTQEHREADGSTFFSSEVVFSCSWTLVGRNVDTLLLDYAPRGGRIVAHPACAVFPSFLALQRDVLPARIIPERQACAFHPNSSRRLKHGALVALGPTRPWHAALEPWLPPRPGAAPGGAVDPVALGRCESGIESKAVASSRF